MLDWPEAVGINEPPPAQVLGKNPGVLRLLAAVHDKPAEPIEPAEG